jgi:hypothetical protein
MRRSRTPEDDPFRDLVAERVELEDGRHLLYFSWPPLPGSEHEEGTTTPEVTTLPTGELDV